MKLGSLLFSFAVASVISAQAAALDTKQILTQGAVTLGPNYNVLYNCGDKSSDIERMFRELVVKYTSEEKADSYIKLMQQVGTPLEQCPRATANDVYQSSLNTINFLRSLLATAEITHRK